MLCQFLQYCGLCKKWPLMTRDEVSRHNTRDSLWIVAGNSVYDVTRLLGIHPGGDGALLKRGGGVTDCQRDFDFHSYTTRRRMAQLKIGELAPETRSRDSVKNVAAVQPCSISATKMAETILTAPCSLARCSNGDGGTGECLHDGQHRNSNSRSVAEPHEEEVADVVKSNGCMACGESVARQTSNSMAIESRNIRTPQLSNGKSPHKSDDCHAACTFHSAV